MCRGVVIVVFHSRPRLATVAGVGEESWKCTIEIPPSRMQQELPIFASQSRSLSSLS